MLGKVKVFKDNAIFVSSLLYFVPLLVGQLSVTIVHFLIKA